MGEFHKLLWLLAPGNKQTYMWLSRSESGPVDTFQLINTKF